MSAITSGSDRSKALILRFSQDGACTCVCIDQVRSGIALEVEHCIPGEYDISFSSGLNIGIDDCTEADLFGDRLQLIIRHIGVSGFRIRLDQLIRLRYTLVEEFFEKYDITVTGRELHVLEFNKTEANVLALICTLIAGLLQRGENLLEVQSLRDTYNIDVLIEVVVLITIEDRCQISGSVDRSSVTL